jgi:hypothetical protein
MSDKQHLDFQVAVLDTLSALVEVSDLNLIQSDKLTERLRVLKEERVRALREWYPEEKPSVDA